MPKDRWQEFAAVMRVAEPDLAERMSRLRSQAPDPAKRPVTATLVDAYVYRLEIHLQAIRGGAEALQESARTCPNLIPEMLAIQDWLFNSNRPGAELTNEEETTIGDWLVSMGRSYSETRRMISEINKSRAGKGAPSKRVETVALLDARIANGWSYTKLASKMCDCGALNHNEYCSDRIRKRLKKLERFLTKHNIYIPQPGKK
jgi:hypothetical protein